VRSAIKSHRKLFDDIACDLRTDFAFSPPSPVVRSFLRGFGFLPARHLLLFPTRRLATPRQTSTVDTSFRCLPLKLLDYEHPYSLVPGASTRCAAFQRRLVRRDRVWDLSLGRGSRRFTTPVVSASVGCIALRALIHCRNGGVIPVVADAANL